MWGVWVGPAIVAAAISAVVTGLGWYVSERQARRRNAGQRKERAIDMQIALLAEIRASQFGIGDIRSQAADIARTFRDQPDYTPFVPRQPKPFVIEALVSDIHFLPAPVIDPVVLYYQQVSAVGCLIEDLRTDRYRELSPDRKQAIYHDYTALLLHQDVLAQMAIEAIAQSLNIPVSALSGPRSDGEWAEVSESTPSNASPQPDMFKQREDSGEPRP